MENAIVVIPARYGSTRLAAKPLAMIHGKPMIQWVYESAKKANGISRVLVATDDERISRVVAGFGGEAMLTSPELPSGTDRVAAVADQVEAQFYVNLQGDEPLMDPRAIEKAVDLLRSGKFSISTIMTPLTCLKDLQDPSVVKVISDKNQRAIYFSRLPIPYGRGPLPADGQEFACKRHVGLYAYTRSALMAFRALPASQLEKSEVLEQLRALENGMAIGIEELDFTSIGVDTSEDLEKVRQYLV